MIRSKLTLYYDKDFNKVNADKAPDRLSNGLLKIDGCQYIIENYHDDKKELFQGIRYSYDDDLERDYLMSTIPWPLELRQRTYFDKKNNPLFREEIIIC